MASSDGRDRKNTPVRKLAIVPNIMLESRSMPSSPTGSNLSLPTQPHVSDPFQKRAMEEISRSTNQFLHIQRALVETTRRSSETPAVPSTFRLNSATTTDSNASSSEDVSITPPGRKTRAFSLTGIEGPLFRKPNFFHRRGSKGGDGQGSTSNLLATALHNVLHKKKYVMKYLYLKKKENSIRDLLHGTVHICFILTLLGSCAAANSIKVHQLDTLSRNPIYESKGQRN